jgi:hypothetical protein
MAKPTNVTGKAQAWNVGENLAVFCASSKYEKLSAELKVYAASRPTSTIALPTNE